MADPEVLVVDDDPDIVALVETVLLSAGYRVRTAFGGWEALAAIEERAPDAVITDVMMPGLDGLSLIARIREHGLALPIILMSAYLQQPPTPTIRLISKPLDFNRLRSELAAALAGSPDVACRDAATLPEASS